MEKHQINEQSTYQTGDGRKLYVHEITGERVSFCRVGELERREASLGRFSRMMSHQVPNG